LTDAAEALRQGAAALELAGIDGPAGDARRLLAHALGIGLAQLRARTSETVPPGALADYRRMIGRRAAREPVSQILGYRDFWKHRFRVTPEVLDPRPETETLVDLALGEPFARVLDLGTGSGCILVSLLLERPEARGVGTDISAAALLLAGENAKRLGVAGRLVLPLSDWFADIGGRYDLIVSNPPYIAAAEMNCLDPEVRDHEPRAALTDGADGLAAYRAIAAGATRHLSPGGRLLVEIGHTQGSAVAGFFRESGLEDVAVHPDLDGRDLLVSARRGQRVG